MQILCARIFNIFASPFNCDVLFWCVGQSVIASVSLYRFSLFLQFFLDSDCIYPVLPCSSASTSVLLALVCLSGRCYGQHCAGVSRVLLFVEAWNGLPLPSQADSPFSLDSSGADFHFCSRALCVCSFLLLRLWREEVVSGREEPADYFLVPSACLTSVQDQVGITGAVQWDIQETTYYCNVTVGILLKNIATQMKRWDWVDIRRISPIFFPLSLQISHQSSHLTVFAPDQIKSIKSIKKNKSPTCISVYTFFQEGHGGFWIKQTQI